MEAVASPAAPGWCPDCPDRIGASVLSLVLLKRPLVDSLVEQAVRVPNLPITSTSHEPSGQRLAEVHSRASRLPGT